MGNRVTNSVQQILAECTNILESAEGTEYVDVKTIAKRLKEESELLHNMFENEPGEDIKISNQKSIVENVGIQLEYMLRVRLGKFDSRFKMRNYANKIYTDMKDLLSWYVFNDGSDATTLAEYSSLTKWALQYYRRSTHLVFETDEEDERMIKRIVEILNQKRDGYE